MYGALPRGTTSARKSRVVKSVGNQDRTTAPSETFAAKVEDGKLTMEEIASLADEIGKIKHPRERAKEAQALRQAIRSSDLSPEDQREAVKQLNQAMAKRPPAWAKAFSESSDSVEDEKETAAAQTSESLINTPLQSASLESVPVPRTLGARRL
jgi:hypothetical protein